MRGCAGPALVVALVALGLPLVFAVPGPFGTGVATPSSADTHVYDNNPPPDEACLQVTVTYTVTLTYAPGIDVLTLAAGGQSAAGSDGAAAVSFEDNICTAFDIVVAGTSVAAAAAYALDVTWE